MLCRKVEHKDWAEALFIAVKEAGPFKVRFPARSTKSALHRDLTCSKTVNGGFFFSSVCSFAFDSPPVTHRIPPSA